MYVRFSAAEQAEVWDRYEAGEYMRPIARAIGRSQGAVRDLIAKTGGVRPLDPTEWSEARLSLTEREEISRGVAGGESARQIAARLGRAPSTISRELKANGGRDAASTARSACTSCANAKRALRTMTMRMATATWTIPPNQASPAAAHSSSANGCVNWRPSSRHSRRRPRRTSSLRA